MTDRSPDLVVMLRELRTMSGLTQREAARKSGVGEKTISSLETGERIGSMKVTTLRKLLAVYGVSEIEFFRGDVYDLIDIQTEERRLTKVAKLFQTLPRPTRQRLIARFEGMIEAALALEDEPESIPTGEPHRADRAEEPGCAEGVNG